PRRPCRSFSSGPSPTPGPSSAGLRAAPAKAGARLALPVEELPPTRALARGRDVELLVRDRTAPARITGRRARWPPRARPQLPRSSGPFRVVAPGGQAGIADGPGRQDYNARALTATTRRAAHTAGQPWA